MKRHAFAISSIPAFLCMIIAWGTGCTDNQGGRNQGTGGGNQNQNVPDPLIARQNAVRAQVHESLRTGLFLNYKGGFFTDDMNIQNNSAYDLSEVSSTLTAKNTNGQIVTRNGFFGSWNRGSGWIWHLPADTYQQITLTGTAKLRTPVDGVSSININIYWNF